MAKAYISNLGPAIKFFEDKVAKAMLSVQDEYASDVATGLDEPPRRTGRIYSVEGNRGRQHQASAPGEPPAPMTRSLLESIRSEEVRRKFPLYVGAVYTDQKQAAQLELGTGKFAGQGRPVWFDSLVSNKSKYMGIVHKEMRDQK